ncbi:MAG: BlaI/MecI/CopY family transcriptional regulator [Bacteroidota bacterium]
MQKLTKAEEQIMQVIWKVEKGFLKEIMEALPEPKPKQSTVSTIIRILKEKGFVDYHAFGKSFQYYPLVSKDAYAKQYFRRFLSQYFDGSMTQMLSFFHKEGDLSLQEMDSLMDELSNKPDHE